MKNIINEKPTLALHGRLKASVTFIDQSDIRGKKVLDIGCGFGWCELNLLNRGVKQATGIELTEADLTAARQEINDPRIDFLVGSAIDLPFQDQTFDTVISWEVLEHIPPHTEERMFQEVARVLKKGGSWYLSTPHNHWLANILDPAWLLIGHRHYQISQLQHFAQLSHLKMVTHFTSGQIWSLLAVLNMYLCKWLLRRPLIAKEFFHQQEDREYQERAGFVTIFAKFKKD